MTQNHLDLTNICRVCRRCVSETEKTSVFTTVPVNNDDEKINEMLMECASVKIHANDLLPSLICPVCIQKLSNSISFKRQCEDTDKFLRNYIKDVKNESSESVNVKEESELKDHISFPCPFCGRYFSSNTKLTEHKTLHLQSDVGVYKCHVCYREFKKQSHFVNHSTVHETGADACYECDLCKKKFRRLPLFHKHFSKHSTTFLCARCNDRFTDASQLLLHTNECPKYFLVYCEICRDTFDDYKSFKSHLNQHSYKYNVIVGYSGKSDVEDSTDNDSNETKSEQTYQCDFSKCDEKFSNATLLNAHVRVKHKTVKIKCTICGDVLANILFLQKHFDEVHSDVRKNLVDDFIRESIVNTNSFGDSSSDEELVQLRKTKNPVSVKNRTNKVTCSVCSRTFKNLTNLSKHERKHKPRTNESGQKNYKCNTCQQSFKSKQKYKTHLFSHNRTQKKQSNKFDVVQTNGISREKIDEEANDHYFNDIFISSFMDGEVHDGKNEKITSDVSLEPKIELTAEFEEFEAYRFKCSVCPKSFASNRYRKAHERTHTGEKRYKCEICHKEFNWKAHYGQHIRRHDKKKDEEIRIDGRVEILGNNKVKLKLSTPEIDSTGRYKCRFCKKTFATKRYCHAHEVTHTGKKRYECEVCRSKFNWMAHYVQHMRTHDKKKSDTDNVNDQINDEVEGEVEKTDSRFKCRVCPKTFATKRYCVVHEATHTGEHKYECSVCHRRYNWKAHFNSHVRRHCENKKKYLCTICGKRFLQNAYLIVHMRRHKGEKPFACQYCNKKFASAWEVTTHTKYHTGEKTHLCTLCGRGFTRLYSLTLHMRTHTGEKPYKCQYCEMAFAQHSDYKIHTRRHTGERLYCDICTKAFVTAYMLAMHKRKVHGVHVQSHTRRFLPSERHYTSGNGPNDVEVSLNEQFDSKPLVDGDLGKSGVAENEQEYKIEIMDMDENH